MAIGPIVISYYVCISTLLCGLCRNCKATFTQYWTCSQLSYPGVFQNEREAHLLTVSVRTEGRSASMDGSRSCPISNYSADKLYSDALLLLRKFQQPRDPQKNLWWVMSSATHCRCRDTF